MATQVASLFAAIGADLSGLNAGMSEAGGKLRSFGKSLTGVGKKLTAAITLPIVGLGAVAVKMAGDFEQQMALLEIALGGTGANMEDVSGYALKMGADTVFGAGEMAEAMMGLAKAGQSWEEIAGDMSGKTGTLAATTSLAAASSLDLASAADTVSVAIATFGLDAKDATAIADSFVQTADASVSEVNDLVAAMANVAPNAAAFGISMGDVNVALALLSERGIAGADAGTKLNSMLLNMMRDTDAVQDAWSGMGLSLYDATGVMRSLPDVMSDLETAMASMTDQQRDQTIKTLAGNYGMTAMQTLLAEGTTGWEGMGAAISEAATAQEVADAKMGGLKGITEELSGALETLGILVGTILIPPLMELVRDTIIPLIERISELDPAVLETGIKILGLAAAIGPLLLVAGQLITVIGTISSVVSALGPVLTFLTGPIGLLIAAIGLLILIWNRFGAEAMGTLRMLVAIFVAVFERIGWEIENFIGKVGAWGSAIIDGLVAGIRSKAGAIMSAISDAVQGAIGWAERLLGIGSPSKVFMEIGQQVSAGLGMGIGEKRGKPKAAVEGMAQQMVTGAMGMGATPMAGGGGGGGGGGGDVIVNMNAPVTVRDDSDIDRIADAIAKRIHLLGGYRVAYRRATT